MTAREAPTAARAWLTRDVTERAGAPGAGLDVADVAGLGHTALDLVLPGANDLVMQVRWVT
jgi:hypothetical protein